MKPPVKTLALITIIFFSITSSHALNNTRPASDLSANVKKIIDDYPNHFENVMGELIIQNPQSSDYHCIIKFGGTEESIITRYSGKRNNISWHAVVLTTDKFDEAKKKFSSVYNQLNNLAIGPMRLKGIYEAPVEEKKFTNSILSLNTDDALMKKLKVEVLMEAEGMEWKVKVLIDDRDREDDERGEIGEI